MIAGKGCTLKPKDLQVYIERYKEKSAEGCTRIKMKKEKALKKNKVRERIKRKKKETTESKKKKHIRKKHFRKRKKGAPTHNNFYYIHICVDIVR